MDAKGARQLQKRLEAHEQWCRADAVRDGRQPATDPDRADLERIGDGVRYYAGGMSKTLVDGCWERSVIEETVEFLDVPSANRDVLPGPARPR
jgi:hypothetical protein